MKRRSDEPGRNLRHHCMRGIIHISFTADRAKKMLIHALWLQTKDQVSRKHLPDQRNGPSFRSKDGERHAGTVIRLSSGLRRSGPSETMWRTVWRFTSGDPKA